MITRIEFASIPVSDQVSALKFYTEKLGFEVLTDVPFDKEGSKRWIEVAPPGAQTKVVLFTCEGQEDRIGTFSNIVFATKDVHKTYEELKAKGVEFTQAPTVQPWGIFAQFKDLDGNEFVLSSSAK